MITWSNARMHVHVGVQDGRRTWCLYTAPTLASGTPRLASAPPPVSYRHALVLIVSSLVQKCLPIYDKAVQIVYRLSYEVYCGDVSALINSFQLFMHDRFFVQNWNWELTLKILGLSRPHRRAIQFSVQKHTITQETDGQSKMTVNHSFREISRHTTVAKIHNILSKIN